MLVEFKQSSYNKWTENCTSKPTRVTLTASSLLLVRTNRKNLLPQKAKRKYATSKAVNSYTMNPSLYPFPRANKVFHFIHPLGITLYGMFAPLSCYLAYREVQSLSIAIQRNNKFSWKRLKDILCSISLKGGGLLLAFEKKWFDTTGETLNRAIVEIFFLPPFAGKSLNEN